MEIKKGTIPKFAKLCFYSGTFTLLSAAFFSMMFYFTNPEVERFVNFLKGDAFLIWFDYNFLTLESLGLSVAFLLAILTASFFGLVSGVFAKVLYSRAQETLESGIEKK